MPAGGRGNEQLVADRFSHNDHFAVQLLVGSKLLRILQIPQGAGQEVIQGCRDIRGYGIAQDVDIVFASLNIGIFQPGNDGLNHIQVAAGTGNNNAVAAFIHREAEIN